MEADRALGLKRKLAYTRHVIPVPVCIKYLYPLFIKCLSQGRQGNKCDIQGGV